MRNIRCAIKRIIKGFLAFLFITILGWVIFMKISPELAVILMVIGACAGLSWLLILDKTKTIYERIIKNCIYDNSIIRTSFKAYPIMCVILVATLVVIMLFPLRNMLLAYATPQIDNPYDELIRTVEAHVEIVVEEKEEKHARNLGGGGFLGFGKEDEPLIFCEGADSFTIPSGGGRNKYIGDFDMIATSNATQHSINYLKEAEYVQIEIRALSENMTVLEGTAVVIINCDTRIELPIPRQTMVGKDIFIRDIKAYLPDF
jgi:hypothetical protein